MKHILFVASESAPFIKTGGLGSVLGSLPKELNRLDMKVSVVIPCYECIAVEWKEKMNHVISFPMQLGWRNTYVDLMESEFAGVSCYFIKNDDYFYGDQPYGEIWQDVEKYAFFCKAVLEMLRYLESTVDIIHCHDWQSGLLPVYMKMWYQKDPYFGQMKTIMTIHNIKFQGILDIPQMKDITGLPDEAFSYEVIESYGDANMLKGGIACADYVTTVSSTYAKEITTEAYGEHLEGLLSYRRKKLCGIVNGIDWEFYNPQTDPYVANPYNKENYEKNRPENKVALQKMTGLPTGKKIFTMGIVSRLTEQKGYDLLEGAIDEILEAGAQLYVLGSGEDWVEEIFRKYQKRFPDQISLDYEYSDRIAKAIYAGCDLTLMPSRFEPCGLNQLMALRYGCLPLVRATGGLKDTVEDDGQISGEGTGFVFENYSKPSFKRCLNRALKMYQEEPNLWSERVRRGMEKDFSWKTSAEEYDKLYDKVIGKI